MSMHSRAQTPAGTSRPVSAGEIVPIMKHMSPSEIDEAVERLNRAKTPAPRLEPLLSPVKISTEELHKSVDRLYTQSVTGKANSHVALERKFLVDRRPHVTMTPEDTNDSVNRLYNLSVKSKNDKHNMLRRKFLLNYERKRDPQAKSKIDHSLVHLYDEEKTRRQDRKTKLHDLYIAPTAPKIAKRDAVDITSIVDRLAVPKGH